MPTGTDLRRWGHRMIDMTVGVPLPSRRLVNEARARAAVTGRLKGRMEQPPQVRLRFTDLPYGFDAIIHREADGFVFETALVTSMGNWWQVGALGSAYAYWLSRCPPEVTRLAVSICDGDLPSGAAFAFSTNLPHVVALPDAYYFGQRGFVRWRDESRANPLAWQARSDQIVWRGSATGPGTVDPVLAAARPERGNQRLLAAMTLHGVPDTDVALSAIFHNEVSRSFLVAQGLLRDPIPEASWLGHKFALDIDGHSNTWSNLIVRLHMGCCVLKVGSRHGYRQWYYDRLKPWEHYVPVAADLSDLAAQLDWVRSNDAEAEQIGRRGQALARSLDWASVEAEAVTLITDNWQRPYPAG